MHSLTSSNWHTELYTGWGIVFEQLHLLMPLFHLDSYMLSMFKLIRYPTWRGMLPCYLHWVVIFKNWDQLIGSSFQNCWWIVNPPSSWKPCLNLSINLLFIGGFNYIVNLWARVRCIMFFALYSAFFPRYQMFSSWYLRLSYVVVLIRNCQCLLH